MSGRRSSRIRLAAEELDRLARSALRTAQAASRIGVSEAEILAMIERHELVTTVRDGNRVVLACQFHGYRLVRHIAEVNAAQRPDLDPVRYEAWLTQPHPALWIYGVAQDAGTFGLAVSPLEWLEHGEDPDLVIRLAAER